MLDDRPRPRQVTATFRHATHPASIAEVRQELRHALSPMVEPDTLGQATLLVSELATNAVRHSGSPWFAVAVEVDGDRLHVEVSDGGSGFAGEPAPDFDRAGGYGLHLVDCMADAWGTEAAQGTRVWFRLSL